MENPEKISGTRLFDIFEQIKQDHIILKMNVIGSGYEGLTMVLRIDSGNEKPFFIIDYPGGTDIVIPVASGKTCHFEFSGKDRIQYSFRASIAEVSEDNIRMNFPEFIERIQRRRSFRVPVPAGTKLFCEINGFIMEFDVINISEGGIYIGHKARYHEKSILSKGCELRNISIISDNEDINTRLQVKSAEIVRLENHREIRRYSYALKFIDVDKNEEDKIMEFIYECQRRVLKRRGALVD